MTDEHCVSTIACPGPPHSDPSYPVTRFESRLARTLKWTAIALCILVLLVWFASGYLRMRFGDGVNYAFDINADGVSLNWAPNGAREGIGAIGLEASYYPSAHRFRAPGISGQGGTGGMCGMQSMNPIYTFGIPFWLAVLLVSAPTVFLWRWEHRVTRIQRRREQGLCLRCGYDLRGTPNGVCSECGLAVESEPPRKLSGRSTLVLLGSYLVPLAAILLVDLVANVPLVEPWTLSQRLLIGFIRIMGPAAWLIMIPFGVPGLLCTFLCAVGMWSAWLWIVLKTRLRNVGSVAHCFLCVAWCLIGIGPLGFVPW
ncbi:MAG: hypothetical protein JSU63_06375 [Phycisphaerales bacterium]|nr:MAG: hypothetical protein JSU63_06375 [Phycisphaerales bacterium]